MYLGAKSQTLSFCLSLASTFPSGKVAYATGHPELHKTKVIFLKLISFSFVRKFTPSLRKSPLPKSIINNTNTATIQVGSFSFGGFLNLYSILRSSNSLLLIIHPCIPLSLPFSKPKRNDTTGFSNACPYAPTFTLRNFLRSSRTNQVSDHNQILPFGCFFWGPFEEKLKHYSDIC
jgi:hypothetical protein